ncbi:MAG: hypothetical protein R3C42_10040 [Parvularculaceae bacterium]
MNTTETNTFKDQCSTRSTEKEETPRQVLLFRDLGVGGDKSEFTQARKTSQAEWARSFIEMHELKYGRLQECVEFYKLTKSEQDSVRYQLGKLARHQRDTKLSNLKSLAPTDPLIDSTSTKFRAGLALVKWKGWGMNVLLYSTLAIVVGLLTTESVSYYTTSRGMSLHKALAFSLVVEMMLVIFFLSKQKQIRFLGWMVFLYSTATCGLWVLHQDSARVESYENSKNEVKSKLEEKEFLKKKIQAVESELGIALDAQKRLLDLGYVTKSFQLRDHIEKKKAEISDLMREISVLDNKEKSSPNVLKAGAFEMDSYSQFGLRILLQLFIMNFSTLSFSRR